MGGDEKEFIRRYQPLLSQGIEASKAQLSPTGQMVVASTTQKRIETRLLLVNYLKKHPEIHKIEVRRPVFVVGFTRTGTTFLHELLGLHPEVCMHYTWEQSNPIPSIDDFSSLEKVKADRAKRYAASKWAVESTVLLAGPEIQSIHRVGIDECEECSTPCGMELPWNIPTISFLPYIAREVCAMGAGSAFKFYKQYLQLLTFQDPARSSRPFTWMLKCPFHLPVLTELNETFPDCTVVWTHRDPVECIGSACSLYETLMRLVTNSETIDRVALGAAVMDYTEVSLEMAEASIAQLGSKLHIVHVRYADNVKNPKAICREVFQQVRGGGMPHTHTHAHIHIDRQTESDKWVV